MSEIYSDLKNFKISALRAFEKADRSQLSPQDAKRIVTQYLIDRRDERSLPLPLTPEMVQFIEDLAIQYENKLKELRDISITIFPLANGTWFPVTDGTDVTDPSNTDGIVCMVTKSELIRIERALEEETRFQMFLDQIIDRDRDE